MRKGLAVLSRRSWMSDTQEIIRGYNSIFLTPSRYIRMGGESRIYKNLPINPNIMGAVRPVDFPPDNIKMYILEPGAYVVDFVETLPFDWRQRIAYHVQQDKLFMSGASIQLNLNPFKALLKVEYRLILEEGVAIAQLLYGEI